MRDLFSFFCEAVVLFIAKYQSSMSPEVDTGVTLDAEEQFEIRNDPSSRRLILVHWRFSSRVNVRQDAGIQVAGCVGRI